MEKASYIIAIDPDVSKSGVAHLDLASRHISVETMTLIELTNLFKGISEVEGTEGIVVVIEDSDTTSNWHLPAHCNSRMAAAIGHGAGLCHATQRHIHEAAKYYGFEVVLRQPLKKTWMGRDGKITQEEIEQFVPDFPKKSNQEIRDAVLLAWCYANLPIRIPADFYTKALKAKR